MLVKTLTGEAVVLHYVCRHCYKVTEWRTGYSVTLAYIRAKRARQAVVLVKRTRYGTLLVYGLTGRL